MSVVPAGMIFHGRIPLFQVFLEQVERGLLIFLIEHLQQGVIGLADDTGVEGLSIFNIAIN
ncbi:hypothetical protein D3C72_2237980 [compost metagenome]